MSYFEMKLAVLMLVCGIVFSQSNNKKNDNSDKMFFPGQINQDGNVLSTSLKIAQQIISITSYEDFFKFINLPPDKKTVIAGRIGSSGQKSNAARPKPAGCKPENQTVSLRPENVFSKFYFPPCTRVRRCGGCCGHYLLSCQPIQTETRNFEVIAAELGEDSQLIYRDREIVAVEEHTKCKCDCKMKAKDCNQKQSYRKQECRCVCTNTDEEKKCIEKQDVKNWDSETCTCACRETEICSSGFYFDNNTCRCREVSILSKFGDISRRTGYRFGQTERPESVPPVIVTLDASDPRRKHKDDPEYK